MYSFESLLSSTLGGIREKYLKISSFSIILSFTLFEVRQDSSNKTIGFFEICEKTCLTNLSELIELSSSVNLNCLSLSSTYSFASSYDTLDNCSSLYLFSSSIAVKGIIDIGSS